MNKNKRIGILGSGDVGQTLANGFIKHGYEVKISSRNVTKLEEWNKQSGNSGSIGTYEETIAFGDIIVLAIKATAAKETLERLGNGNLDNKIIIDATNPIADIAPENGVLKYFTSLDKSLMEELQETLPNAHFVKAFNSVGSAFMVNPDFENTPTMIICGNNETAKQEVSEILTKFGWEAKDFGKVESARAIEPLAMLWCIPGLLRNEWSHAFRLMN